MKKIFTILFALALVLSLGVATEGPVLADGTIINVPGDFATIQAAVNASGPGDTIRVAAGEHDAFVVLEKQNIRIVGAEGATVTSASSVPIYRGSIEDAWVMAGVKDSEDIRIDGISFDGSGIIGEQSVIGIAYVDSTGDIRDLTVENMVGTNVGVGIAIIGAGTVGVTGTGITGNMVGLYFFDNPVAEANYNTIEDNTLFGALNQGTAPVSALYNYWGSALGPFHPTLNHDGLGNNAVSDNVDFSPWASGPRFVMTVSGAGDHMVDARDDADTVVRIKVLDTASGLVQATNNDVDSLITKVTIDVLSGNPDPDADRPSILWTSLNKYIKVGVTSNGEVPEARIELYYGSDLATELQQYYTLLWLNEDRWAVVVGDSGVVIFNEQDDDGYHGYMYAVLTNETTPPVSYLNDGDWGGYAGPTEPGGGLCAIATAAYGTDTAHQLDILREFRDTILLPNSMGNRFVSFYYRTSPPIAAFISRHEGLRTAVRVGLVDPIVKILNRTYESWSRSDW